MSTTTAPTWATGTLVGFDTETTGVDVENDRIVTASIVVDDGAGNLQSLDVLIDPGVDIPEAASNVHGISTEHAREHGKPAREGIAMILEYLRTHATNAPIVAYNGVYDLTILDREARRHGLEPFEPRWMLDPLVIDKQVDKYRRGSRKLIDTATLYGFDLRDAHTARADVEAAIAIARALPSRHPKLMELSLDELHAKQISWKREQGESFRDYLLRQGRNADDVEVYWPVRPLLAAV